jgi:hypothetical protein
MSELIKKHAKLLHFLCTCKKAKQRNALVGVLPHDALKAIAECNYNVIKGTVPLSKAHLVALKRNKKLHLNLDEDSDIAHLQGTARREALDEKRKNILQQGGVLPALLAPLLGAVISPIIKSGVGAIKSRIKAKRKRKQHEKQIRETLRKIKQKRKQKK